MKTVWYDVSEICEWQGHFTGIQRVIYSVGKHLLEQNENYNLKLIKFDRSHNIFVEAAYDFVEHSYRDEYTSNTQDHRLHRTLNKIKASMPVSLKRNLIMTHEKLKVRLPIESQILEQVKISKEDLIVSPGAFWTGFLDSLDNLKLKSNAKVVGVIYDLVPIMVPQYTAEVTIGQYERELPKALKVYDHWLSISQNSKEDLLTYAKKVGVQISPNDISVFRLGDDIELDAISDAPEVKIPEDYMLFVSTIEARKNQNLVYQVVKLAYQRGVEIPPIVLVGKHGWLSDDLIYLLRNDPLVKKSIIWLEKIDDKKLRWLYENCLFTIYPSFYEGWGLPVAESLAYHKPCIASNTSSIPEIAGDLIEYFSPYDPTELLDLIIKFLDHKDLSNAVRKASKYKMTTWSQTATQVQKIINSI